MAYTAAYLALPGAERYARRATSFPSRRGVAPEDLPTWAALRELGRDGVAELVERCCALARRFADQLGAADGVEVVNDVVLNQVLVRFGEDTDADRDATTDRVIDAVQRSGECWMGGTTWRGMRLMRISVSNWSTTGSRRRPVGRGDSRRRARRLSHRGNRRTSAEQVHAAGQSAESGA